MLPPSRSDFLKGLLGKRLMGLIRYSWWPANEVASACDISANTVFSLAAGPLSIIFEGGEILGVSSDPALNSVLVWDEGRRCVDSPSLSFEQDGELFPILASDKRYANPFWQQMIGLTLSGISILKKSAMSCKERELPSERGVRFQFENGKSFIASHGLHDGSDDFSVLEISQMMAFEIDEICLD